MTVGIALLLFALATRLSRRRNVMTYEEVAAIIERFLDGAGDVWDWDDFITRPLADDLLDTIRKHCATLREQYPPTEANRYTNERGEEILRGYVRQLRGLTAEREQRDSAVLGERSD